MLCLALVLPGLTAFGQITKVTGKIIEAFSDNPVPFANVYFKGTTVGVTSNEDGTFRLETTAPVDSIVVSFMGYISQTKHVKRGASQIIDFRLSNSEMNLQEVVILPDEELVQIIMKRVFKNKELNDPEKIQYYQCSIYNKMQVDLNNISEAFMHRKVFKPFEFIFENIDTNKLNNKTYLPVFISETNSDYYYRKDPPAAKEFIRASEVSGVENQSITQFLGGMFQNINIYDNYLNLFDKNFVSPVANFGLTTYKYTLQDTVIIDNKTCFQIAFQPKRKQELTFSGTLWINDTTFAVKKVQMRMADDANINFINDFYIELTCDNVNGEYWVVTKDYRLADLNPMEEFDKTVGFYAHRTAIYRNFIFDKPLDKEFYSSPTNVIVDKDAMDKSKAYWIKSRPDTLSKEEKQIYQMVDSIKNVPVFHTYVDFIYMVTSGYLKSHKFEFGPLYKSLSFNSIEGIRLRFGGRTSNAFSKKLMLEGHVAFGTKDLKFKYGLGFLYMLNKNPRRSVGANFSYDMEQLGQSQNAFSEDNFFAAFFRRSPANKLNMVREFSGFYQHEWFTGFSNTVKLIRRDIYAIGEEKFTLHEGGQLKVKDALSSTEIQIQTRFAYHEKFVSGEFERISLGTKYPVLEVNYGYGSPCFLGGEFEYHRLQFRIHHWFNVFNIGWSKYVFEIGKIWGTLPYSMLELHPGNETVLFYENANNLMNYYEFISDKYMSLYYTHHFDGLFFNKIPLLRKLKWREVIHGRGVWGTLSQQNQEYSVLPNDSQMLDKPYFEAGVGIENIFKVGRIDAVWRLSHLDSPGATRFRIFFSFQFSF